MTQGHIAPEERRKIPRLILRRLSHAASRKITPYGFLAVFSPLASTSVAVIVYMTVTFEPTFALAIYLVLALRATSQRSLPFCTTIIVSFISSTGPVT